MYCRSMPHIFSLKEQTIVVTGATGALAGATAQHLVSEGAHVVFVSRTQSNIDEAVSACIGLKGTATGFACDVTDSASVTELRDEVLAKFGRIDGLVNGAGGNKPGAVVGPDASIFDLDIADYNKVLELNLQGTLIPSLVFAEAMVKQGKGAIVNFSSMAARPVITRVLGYSNAKAAIDNQTKWLAVELAKRHGEGVRVNAVAPGFFVGEQNRALLLNPDGSLTDRGQRIVEKTPMGRFGASEEVVGAVHYLLSDAARFVTGDVLAIDGGFSAFSGV